MSTPRHIDPVDVPSIDQIARKRGIQTALQGLALDILVAIALALAPILPSVESWRDVQTGWTLWLLLVAKSVVQAVLSWVLRRWGDQSGVDQIASA